MVKVRLENISKKRNNDYELKEVNLHVKDKELFVIAGPPGSGKSEILRIIAGLDLPDEGDVYIGDECVTDVPPHKRGVSMVFQSLALYPNKTVFDNIAFPLQVRKIPKEEIRRRVKEVAELLKIDHILHKYPRFLSGGEQQRVAVARAMITNPRLYLFDQPLANLDALIRANMREEIKRLSKELGTTTIYVTHENIEALSLGDRIAYIEKGRIIGVGTAEDFINNPHDYRIARYFSNINTIETTITEKNGKYYATLFNQKIELPLKEQPESTEALAVFKINDSYISKPDEVKNGERIATAGKILMVEEYVRNRIYSIQTETGEEIRVFTSDFYELDSTVNVVIPKDRLMFFEKKSLMRML